MADYVFENRNKNALSPLIPQIYAVRNAEILTSHEAPLQPLSPQPGWIEFDPLHIWRCCVECINQGCKNLVYLDINPADIVAIGLTNQRETSVLWHRHTGVPLYNAIAWNDVRTGATLNAILAQHRQRKSLLQSVCGLPLSNCFSALKVKWMIANVAGVEALVAQNSVLFGTLDTWIMWQLTGGIEGGVHVTDVTNASRTMLMALETRRWDPQLCAFFRIPSRILPEIRSCAEVYGFVHDGPLRGVPIAGVSLLSYSLLYIIAILVINSSFYAAHIRLEKKFCRILDRN